MYKNGESKIVEYKQEYSKTILKTICAYANFHDGVIILGIKDDGSVIGVTRIEELKLNIENAINDNILPTPYYEFKLEQVNGAQLLLIKVYKGDYTPYTYNGKSYMRRDTSTIQTDTITMQNLILAGRNLSFEDLKSEETKLTFDYFEKLMKKEYKISSLSEDLLRTLGFKKNDDYNIAAVLISDENPIPNAAIDLVAFSSTGVGRIKDRLILENMSILEQFEECMVFYKKHINKGEIIEAVYRQTVEDVPLLAYREAVANMIVHRDYSISANARIEFFSNRIEVVSPGGLPDGMLVEEYVDGKLSKPRNRILTDIFLRLKIIEKLATGIRRIKEQYIGQRDKPIFRVSENSVIVILPYIQESERAENKIVRENDLNLTSKERKIYELIRSKPFIKRVEIQKSIHLEKSQTVELLNGLREMGLIIKVGNGPATGYKIP